MKTISIIFLMLCSSIMYGQEAKKTSNYTTMFWFGHYSQIKLNKYLSINTDIQFRTREGIKHPSQALVRTGLQYKRNEKFSFTGGMAHFRFFINDYKTRGEWRPWQEFAIMDQHNKLQLVHRFRVEERFNQQTKGNLVLDTYNFSFRFRYKMDMQYLLRSSNKESLKVTLGNEVMLNAGRTIKYNYFDQNRISIGLLVDYLPNFIVQTQYIFINQQMQDGLTVNQSSVFRVNVLQKF